jgi:hypothetical protein
MVLPADTSPQRAAGPPVPPGADVRPALGNELETAAGLPPGTATVSDGTSAAAGAGRTSPAEPPAGPAQPGQPQPAAPPDADRSPGGIPGLPRLYFPDPDEPAPGRDHGAPAGGRPPAWHQPQGRGLLPREPGQRHPSPRQAKPKPTRPPEREVRQRAVAALVFGLLSVLALVGIGSDLHRGILLIGFSVLFGPTACVLGITAMRKARRADAYRPRWAIAGVVLGVIASTFAIPVLLLYLVFPRPLTAYVTCLSRAQSASGSQACTDQLYQAIQNQLGGR